MPTIWALYFDTWRISEINGNESERTNMSMNQSKLSPCGLLTTALPKELQKYERKKKQQQKLLWTFFWQISLFTRSIKKITEIEMTWPTQIFRNCRTTIPNCKIPWRLASTLCTFRKQYNTTYLSYDIAIIQWITSCHQKLYNTWLLVVVQYKFREGYIVRAPR